MRGTTGHEDLHQVLHDVVQQLDPRKLVAEAISLDDRGRLIVPGGAEPLAVSGEIVVVAVGKASVPMAAGALDSLGEKVLRAVAVTKSGIPLSVDSPESLEIIESDHPVPTEVSLDAGKQVRKLVEEQGEDDIVLMLISGGGSALVEDLVDGVSLEDLQQTTDHLLRAGATINELNAVRRRLSRIKGGRLAKAAAPAKIVNYIISDVLNSPLQDIASGPTVKPPENDKTFFAVMQRTELIDGLPSSVRSQLDAQKDQSEDWTNTVAATSILADAVTAARIAVASATGLGYQVQTLGFDFQGEAREFGRAWSTIARHAARDVNAFSKPVALIGTGELTVTVQGDGTGGRNTEMALAAAIDINGTDGVTICSFATDGDDGVSGCAGGIVDGSTLQALEQSGVDVAERLQQNDSATVLKSIDAVIDIGPTGTNVNDLYIALIEADE